MNLNEARASVREARKDFIQACEIVELRRQLLLINLRILKVLLEKRRDKLKMEIEREEKAKLEHNGVRT